VRPTPPRQVAVRNTRGARSPPEVDAAALPAPRGFEPDPGAAGLRDGAALIAGIKGAEIYCLTQIGACGSKLGGVNKHAR
jgi:hypothetical protein